MTLAIISQLLAFIARVAMAKYRFEAVILLAIASVVGLAWSCSLNDWPTFFGTLANLACLANTYFVWNKERGKNAS